MTPFRRLEKYLAVASFATAVALAFTSMLLTADHDVAANVTIVIAQFLTLTATILGIDYKFNSYANHVETPTGAPQQ